MKVRIGGNAHLHAQGTASASDDQERMSVVRQGFLSSDAEVAVASKVLPAGL